MGNYIVFIFLLTILHSVLFYSKRLGLNVILFIIPLLIFLVYILHKEKKIVNKKGLLFIIPILLLSCSYFVYNNALVDAVSLTSIAIPALILLMFIYTTRPTESIKELISKITSLIFEPLNCIGKFYNIVKMKINERLKLSDSSKKVLKSALIVLPIIALVLILLSSADMIFSSMFTSFFKVFKNIKINSIIGRIIIGFIFFTYLGAVINYLLFSFDKIKETNSKNKKIESFTIKLLLTSLNIIYIVFDFIQIKSLMLHKVATSINYAQYARSGFFQLMFISLINISIILISKYAKEETKYSKVMSIIMVFLTFIIIISSILRMHMYEAAYGYTTLRLLVYVTLFTEIILLIPTIAYILNSKVKVLTYYIVIITIAYTLVGISPIDHIIANNNINRYYEKNKIDIKYLENYNADNVPDLINLYNKTEDVKLKEEIKGYFETNIFYETKGFQEFNISKQKARKQITKLIKYDMINQK